MARFVLLVPAFRGFMSDHFSPLYHQTAHDSCPNISLLLFGQQSRLVPLHGGG